MTPRIVATIGRMTILHAVLLGIVEGISEFLPISSTAHLILSADLLGITRTPFRATFEIFIQLGAILAVVVLYWRSLLQSRAVLVRVFIAFLPTAVIGLLLHKFVKMYLFDNRSVVLWALFLGGIVILLFERWHDDERSEVKDMEQIPLWTAAMIGVCQAVAIVPGVSRSAATIIGGMALGIRRRTIVDFTFLLAIPTMLAATLYDLYKSAGSFSSNQFTLLGVGLVVSFVSALFVIRWFLGYIRHHSFAAFGIYRIAIALIGWMV